MTTSVSYKEQLSQRLDKLVREKKIESYSFSQPSGGGWKVLVHAPVGEIELHTDLTETMDLTVNHYFRNTTDYLIGDFNETIDWYVKLIQAIVGRKYTLILYRNGEKTVSKRMIVDLDGSTVTMGDRVNHFTLLSKKTEIKGGDLD